MGASLRSLPQVSASNPPPSRVNKSPVSGVGHKLGSEAGVVDLRFGHLLGGRGLEVVDLADPRAGLSGHVAVGVGGLFGDCREMGGCVWGGGLQTVVVGTVVCSRLRSGGGRVVSSVSVSVSVSCGVSCWR